MTKVCPGCNRRLWPSANSISSVRPLKELVRARVLVPGILPAFQDLGLGAALLRDSVLHTRQAADIVGIRAILVQAISREAKRFYERYGFTESPVDPMTLMLSLADVDRIGASR